MASDRVVASVRLFGYLVVPIQIELDDATVATMQEQLLREIERYGVRGLILDVSMVDTIDSFICFTLSETAQMARMMGCMSVLCGIQPHVALTLAQMGISLEGIMITRDLEEAIALLDGDGRVW